MHRRAGRSHPGKIGGIRDVRRSKQLQRVAYPAPYSLSLLVATHLHRPSWSNLSSSFSWFRIYSESQLRRALPSSPEVLVHEIALSLSIHPRQVVCAIAIDKPNNLLHRVLWWDRQHHVHDIGHQMPLSNPVFFLRTNFLNTSPKCSRSCLAFTLDTWG